MLNIEWKPIDGYEGLYEVSNDGRVRRLRFINTENQRKIAKQVMLDRWKNNNHREERGIKRTKEEKREYQRRYYQEHKNMKYEVK